MATSVLRAAVVAVAVLAARTAAAETFLLKDGGRVFGEFEQEVRSDDGKRTWYVVRTSYGRVHLNRADVEKRLAAKGRKDTIHLREARVHTIEGTASKSADDGKTWVKIPWGDSATSDRAPMPVVRAGERVRTGEKSRLVLDVAYGTVVLDASADVRLCGDAGPTIEVVTGRAGAHVEGLPADRRFEVELGGATLGVKGTTFVVDTGSESCAVRDGKVEFAARDGSWTTTVSAGGAATRGASREPTPDETALLDDAAATEAFPRVDWVRLPAAPSEFSIWVRDAPGAPVRVQLPARWIARTEVTVADVNAFRRWCAKNPVRLVRHPTEPEEFRTEGEYSDPQGGAWPADDDRVPAPVGWAEAWAFCRWIGARLPSETEWDHAAREGEPWRPSRDAVFLKRTIEREWVLESSGAERIPPLDLAVDTDEAFWKRIDELRGTTAARVRPVGTGVANEFGLHDVLGNLDEWTGDVWTEDVRRVPRDGKPLDGPPGSRRFARGGLYSHPALIAHPGFRILRDTDDPDGRHDAGFRPALTHADR